MSQLSSERHEWFYCTGRSDLEACMYTMQPHCSVKKCSCIGYRKYLGKLVKVGRAIVSDWVLFF